MSRKIESVLIANRGEPVRRGLKTYRTLGLRVATIAVVEDLSSPWVAECDQVRLVSSYLSIPEIIQAARSLKVDAVWPAWGFLSENTEFARAIEQAGFAWIGPPGAVIESMGSKAVASEKARKAGLTTIPEIVIPGKGESEKLLKQLIAASLEIGFPLLLKPALGGGGQGQQKIFSKEELEKGWNLVLQTNAKQFQSGPILVQRLFSEAKHIETQILADSHGSVFVLGERDCSVQRRNQKVIEESPSPLLTQEERRKLFETSRSLARAIGYVSAGTIEYLYAEKKFYFLEMNTRLQVEHPVTEETTWIGGRKIDLVEQMLKIAEGKPLGWKEEEIERKGHAIEIRLYAEDPEQEFRPSPGTIQSLVLPSELVRVDSAFPTGRGEISRSYDPMIAKMIAVGSNREEAISKLDQALGRTTLLGLPTNIALGRSLLQHPRFRQGDYTTSLLQGFAPSVNSIPRLGLSVAVATVLRYLKDLSEVRQKLYSSERTSLLQIFRQIPSNGISYEVRTRFGEWTTWVGERSPNCFRVTVDSRHFEFYLFERGDHLFTLILSGGEVIPIEGFWQGNRLQLPWSQNLMFEVAAEGKREQLDPHASPMGGQIASILVQEGETVLPGRGLYQIESMKMITTIQAATGGVIKKIHGLVGEAVQSGQSVLQLVAPVSEPKEKRKTVVDLGESISLPEEGPSTILLRYFQGFDIPADEVQERIKSFDGHNLLQFADTVAEVLEKRRIIQELAQEHTHVILFMAERASVSESSLPQKSVALLKGLLPDYGLQQIADLNQPRPFIHIFQAFGQDREKKEAILLDLLNLSLKHHLSSPALTQALIRWLKGRNRVDGGLEAAALKLLLQIDPALSQEISPLPVAPEYLAEYEQFNKNPAAGIPAEQYLAFRQSLDEEGRSEKISFQKFPDPIRPYLERWFGSFLGREISLPDRSRESGIFLYELGGDQEIPPRFLIIGLVPNTQIDWTGPVPAFPFLERAAIEAYRILRLAQVSRMHGPNHVLIVSTDPQPVPWKTRDAEGGQKVLTPGLARLSATRISGFASGIQVAATEVILPLLNRADQKIYQTIIEVRHTKPHGVMSRPPFLIEERKPEQRLDKERQLNERQHQLGKLLNRDRAMLLFDQGEYEELLYPEVDDQPEIGLNVYRGRVGGILTIAYAGDFRHRGGALGEREGKKLASAVILAYFTGCPIVAFHDGAGANIKESVASLGWAGTYFGAIAQTGGFSNKEKFRQWFENHHEQAYFQKMLDHFGLKGSLEEFLQKVPRQLIHFHLHVGATVGMLVYGASVAHLSLMADHPEAYRVLTGAATVNRVLGEKGSNYSLGGAKAHSEESGDVEMVFSTEEEVIDQTRRLLKLFYQTGSTDRIDRDPKIPHLEVPREAGVIFGRDSIRGHVDRGEFFEVRKTLRHATGIMTGYTSVAGRPIGLVATATDYGLSHPKAFKKVTLFTESAQELQIPLVLVTGAQWHALPRPVSADWLFAREELSRILTLSDVPKISLALGPRSIEQIVHQRMDLTLYIHRGEESHFEKTRVDRLAPLQSTSIAEGFDLLAKILGFIQQPNRTSEDSLTRTIRTELPLDLKISYDIRGLIREVFDQGSFLELWGADKLPLITGFARIGGQVVGVIADDPAVEAGAQSVLSIAKFTKLHRLCERFHLPLIQLNDSPAFRPGREQEHGGIQGEGGKSIREECLSPIPKIAVTLRQNYGGRFVHANLITLGPPRVGLVLQGARIGVMGAKGAVGVLYGKKLAALPEEERKKAESVWQKEYEEKQLNPENAVQLGYVKPPVDLKRLRAELYHALQGLKFTCQLSGN